MPVKRLWILEWKVRGNPGLAWASTHHRGRDTRTVSRWGCTDAESQVPTAENPELAKVSDFKPASDREMS